MGTKQSLLTQLSSKESLHNAWNLLKKENLESHGLSGITTNDFSKHLESNLYNISKELISENYVFSPTRAAVIKKDNGKFRPLQIPEIKDRVVLKAMAILLEERLDSILVKSKDVSFAYQQGKGVREAVLKLKSLYKEEGYVVLKADIINFFEEVQKDKMLNELIYPNLEDDSINTLIKASMSQKLGGLKKLGKKHFELFKNAGKGIPQGNPLSPLLSNIYLSNFDIHLKESGYSLIRYADDFIVVFKSKEDAKKGYEEIYKFLYQNFSLKIHPLEAKEGKTEIINPCEKEFSFLSIKFDGKNIYPSRDTVSILKCKIRNCIKNGDLNPDLFADIYKSMKKWIALYSYLDIERYFDDIDSFLIAQLNKKFGKRNYKITKCKQLTQKVRNKQYKKSKKSFWRKAEFTKFLPKFIEQKLEVFDKIKKQ